MKEKMVKKRIDKNLISIIIGSTLILIGLAWASIIINSENIASIIAAPGILLIIGTILAFIGGLGKWN